MFKLSLAILLAINVSCPKDPQPDPSPSIPPVTTTTTTTTTLAPSPIPTALPVCIAKLPVLQEVPGGMSLYMNAGKAWQGADSTPRVRDWTYCTTVSLGNPVYDCKANPEGSGYTGCDTQFLGQNCPTWEFRVPNTTDWKTCRNVTTDYASCDHFDHWAEWRWKDPDCTNTGCPQEYNSYTGPCDVDPVKHEPITGFFMIPHGEAYFRACNKDRSVCSNELFFNQ